MTLTWISVKDRLPYKKDGDSVLVAGEDREGYFVLEAVVRPSWSPKEIFCIPGCTITKYVTHWMPIPPHPLTIK